MTVEKIICDECGRVKAEANHWHQVGVTFAGQIGVQVGYLYGAPHDSLGDPIPGTKYEVHDLCGEQCFIKHICKLLGMGGIDGATEG